MSYANFTETAIGSIPTPAAGTVNLSVINESVPILATKDDAGIVSPLARIVFTTADADFTGTNVNTAQPIFPAAQDTLTVAGSTAYLVEMRGHIHTTGTTSHTFALLFGGTATFTNFDGVAQATNAATEVLGAVSALNFTSAAGVVLTPATATATHHSFWLDGIMRVNAGGTVIPQYQWSAAPGVAGVTLRGAWCRFTPIGVNTITASPSTMWS